MGAAALLAHARRSPPPRRLSIEKLANLVVAALVSPYHPVICLAVFAASLLRSKSWRYVARWMVLGLACVGIAAWFAGYFAREGAGRQWGFEFESTNLLSWLVPVRSGIVGDARWLANVDATGYQYEGYAYLGLGTLILLAAFTVHWQRGLLAIRNHRVLFVVLAGFCVLALSNHIYFGSHEVVSYPIPHALKWLPNQFRSPGRFVWLPTYVLVTFLLHWAFSTAASPRLFAALALTAVVQVADARGDWALQRTLTQAPSFVMGGQPKWRELVYAHEAVFIMPTYSCVFGDNGPTLDFVSMEIQMLASERALPINGTYSTRARRRCSAEERDWATVELRPNTLYVLLPQATAVADRFQAQGASCAAFDFGRVCSSNRDAIRRAFGTK